MSDLILDGRRIANGTNPGNRTVDAAKLAEMSAKFVGWFRVYYNRDGAAPLFWCISPENGAWELCVTAVDFDGVQVRTIKDVTKHTADDDDGKPSAWIRAFGQLTLSDGGVATIKAVE